MSEARSVEEIIADIDALLATGDDAGAEKELMGAIIAHAEAEPGDGVGQSALLNELGGFYRSRGRFAEGEKAYLAAKVLLEAMRERGGNIAVNYATTLNNLAGLYRMAGQLQQAGDMFDEAIQAYENCEGGVSPDYLASAYNNKGLVYLDLRDVARAKAQFLKAKAILESSGTFAFAMGTTISNLGFAAVMEKQFSAAAECFRTAQTLFLEAGDAIMAQNCTDFLTRLEEGR